MFGVFRRRRSQPPVDIQSDHPKVRIEPQANIYSYIMFSVLERSGSSSWVMCEAYTLLGFTVFFQAVVLYVILHSIAFEDIAWQNGIIGPSSVFGTDSGNCSGGHSLCRPGVNGTFSCAPPSVRIAGSNLVDWSELDLNGDDVWSYSEATAVQDELRCKYHVNVTEVFGVFQEMALNYADVIPIAPELENGSAIAKPYFVFVAADVIMCGYRSAAMCPNLLRAGIFDAPLAQETSPRVGTTIMSAMDYCYGLLEDGGICDRTLPSTYATWRKLSEEQCLEPDYDEFTYHHPTMNLQKSFLVVDYAAYKNFKKGESTVFILYKAALVGVYIVTLYMEAKNVLVDVTWAINCPSSSEVSDKPDASPAGNPGVPKTQGTTREHRCVVSILIFVRILVILLLIVVGLFFLLNENSEVDLLLNSIGLVFVMEVSGIMYSSVVDDNIQREHAAHDPFEIDMIGSKYLNQRPALKDTIGLCVITFVVVAVIIAHRLLVVTPVFNAVSCTCLSQGDNCQEAAQFGPRFWQHYWAVEAPAALKQIDILAKGGTISKPQTNSSLTTNSSVDDSSVVPRSRLPMVTATLATKTATPVHLSKNVLRGPRRKRRHQLHVGHFTG